MEYTISCKTFSELSKHELYAVLRLRVEVFVVEQKCVFQDIDGKDPYCHHLMFWLDNQLIAYARLAPPGKSYAEKSIERVISSSLVRGQGIGKLLVQQAIAESHKLFGISPIKIGAQVYTQKFYEALGFKVCAASYLIDGIPHFEMIHGSLN